MAFVVRDGERDRQREKTWRLERAARFREKRQHSTTLQNSQGGEVGDETKLGVAWSQRALKSGSRELVRTVQSGPRFSSRARTTWVNSGPWHVWLSGRGDQGQF